jgi:hypothetical protein
MPLALLEINKCVDRKQINFTYNYKKARLRSFFFVRITLPDNLDELRLFATKKVQTFCLTFCVVRNNIWYF